jgi:hypothetical protein
MYTYVWLTWPVVPEMFYGFSGPIALQPNVNIIVANMSPEHIYLLRSYLHCKNKPCRIPIWTEGRGTFQLSLCSLLRTVVHIKMFVNFFTV